MATQPLKSGGEKRIQLEERYVTLWTQEMLALFRHSQSYRFYSTWTRFQQVQVINSANWLFSNRANWAPTNSPPKSNCCRSTALYHSMISPSQAIIWWFRLIWSLNKTLSIPLTEVSVLISPSKSAISVFTKPGCKRTNSIFSDSSSLANVWIPILKRESSA